MDEILQSLKDTDEDLVGKASKILVNLDAKLIESEHFSSQLREISKISDIYFFRVISVIFDIGAKNVNNLKIISQNGWIDAAKRKLDFSLSCDPLIVLNTFEIEQKLLNSILKYKDLEFATYAWRLFQSQCKEFLELLTVKTESVIFLGLLINGFFGLIRSFICLHYSNLSSASLDEQQWFNNSLNSLLEQFSASSQDIQTKCEVILAIGTLGGFLPGHALLGANAKLVQFYREALYSSDKLLKLNFIYSIVQLIRE